MVIILVLVLIPIFAVAIGTWQLAKEQCRCLAVEILPFRKTVVSCVGLHVILLLLAWAPINPLHREKLALPAAFLQSGIADMPSNGRSQDIHGENPDTTFHRSSGHNVARGGLQHVGTMHPVAHARNAGSLSVCSCKKRAAELQLGFCGHTWHFNLWAGEQVERT